MLMNAVMGQITAQTTNIASTQMDLFLVFVKVASVELIVLVCTSFSY